MKNGIWWLLGAIGLLAVASSGKGKEKEPENLSGLNTAKTKRGKERQRKAVFAKMDEVGKTYPKNKKGVRKKPRKGLSGSFNTYKTITGRILKVRSNASAKTFTIKTDSATYRTIKFPKDEFVQAKRFWTGDDWQSFLKTDEYYKVK